MMKNSAIIFAFLCLANCLISCNQNKSTTTTAKPLLAIGLYRFGPEEKVFFRCDNGKEYWVIDSAKTVELSYFKLGFEKPYVPVYLEANYELVKSDSLVAEAGYDSTMVILKQLKMSKEIPRGICKN